MLKSSLLLLILSLCCISILYAQNGIFGKITDSLQRPIAYANVALMHNGLIIAFTQSDEKGGYALKVSAKQADSQKLQFTSIGYEKKIIAITALQMQYNVVMKPSHQVLKEIEVKGKPAPVQKRGDTTNFDLSFFKAPQDRVIEDVLKKIPGIEISDEGKISYKGKSITSFLLMEIIYWMISTHWVPKQFLRGW